MQLIENFEVSKRGLYSGAIGYFEPNGDFDFNVAIRTILYNRSEQFVSYSVGSAITTASEAESEYEECLLKANALSRVLAQDDLTKVVSHD
jgi:para-aminobenzoate synthetase component I